LSSLSFPSVQVDEEGESAREMRRKRRRRGNGPGKGELRAREMRGRRMRRRVMVSWMRGVVEVGRAKRKRGWDEEERKRKRGRRHGFVPLPALLPAAHLAGPSVMFPRAVRREEADAIGGGTGRKRGGGKGRR
jgi:hypothetical protein